MLILLFAAVLVIAFFAPTQNVRQVNLANTLENPSIEHPFGTDNLGRDVFSLMVEGLMRTLMVVVIATIVSFVVGILLGVISGYYGGIVGGVIQFVSDFTLILPPLICALILTAIIGFNPISIGFILGFTHIGEYTNQTTILCRSIRQSGYVESAIQCGIPSFLIILRHVLPNVLNPLLTFMGNRASGVTISYASLAFIGLGADITNPDWGSMIYQYRTYIFDETLLLLWPSLGILFLSLFFHFMFDDSNSKDLDIT